MKNYKILFIFSILSCLFGLADDAFKYSLDFITSDKKEDHFIIQINVEINKDFYMSSSSADKDKFQFQTEIEWPQSEYVGRGCFDSKGNELVDDWGFSLFIDRESCLNNNSLWTYGYWIEDLKKYHDAPLFEKIGIMIESKKPEIKMGVPIQKGNLNIQQKYKLVNGLQNGVYNLKGKFIYQVCDERNGVCEPKSDSFSKLLSLSVNNENYSIVWDNESVDIEKTINNTDCSLEDQDEDEDSSLIGSFFTAILAGLIAILTPCVFPMIPMTVAFFSKDAKKDKNQAIKTGILFGVSIIVIFSIVGVFFSALFGATMANELATNNIANIIFAIVFLVFAISFFGYFEIRVPNALLNKINKKADNSTGLLGIFFMALTLVLVSFSCTAPIVGTVMIDAVAGNFLKPIIVMLGFSLAFAIPFSLFAIFPSWLESLPQSGGWLNSVKIVLGFLELALCIKFLSMPDQAYHWGILGRNVFLIIWIIIFIAMGLYLLGIVKFKNDTKINSFSYIRVGTIVVTFVFCAYMIQGLFGGKISLLAGIVPPEKGEMSLSVKYADKLHLPPGFTGYFDYEEAKSNASILGKPLFIDFTGHGCFNCRLMEENVWSDPNVKKILDEEYVIVALYVDDRTPLVGDDKYKTLGKKNFALQMDKFCSNAQPYYVLLDPKTEKKLTTPKAYETNIQSFVDFLNEGLNNFKNK